jgi:hypothetical protein
VQVTNITHEQMRELLSSSEKYNRPIEIDWANRTIQVLSEMRTHPTVKLSSGPMQYQDRLASYKF